MPETILRTKLYVPPLRPNLVPRPRLIERLNKSLHLGHKLTLISAPAGFGKTTLASEWVAGCQRPAAWLSLDEGDNTPTRFLTYLVAALQTIAPAVAEGVLAMLHSPQPAPIESILTALLNEISTVPHKFVLVLDDYHLLDTQAVDASTSVDEALTFLLEHLPPNMHLVTATREDPDLTLARLRARGQLSELRAADLRFTPAEAAAFFNQVMDLDLSEEEITALETRTEGWITGLQLAAISMQGRTDTASFIQAFTGSHNFVLDYLVEEVLQRQPQHVRSFLLQTSILNRLSGPLCDAVRFGDTPSNSFGTAVSGQKDGRGMLEALERGNLFVIPLDNVRRWYRYHHLFTDVLQAHLMEEQPNQVASLHRRASEWYEQNDLPSDAVRHALAAGDFERAAGLAELQWRAMDRSFQSAIWLGWVKALPDDLIRARPVLSTEYAWALLDGGELEAAGDRLRDAERCLDITTNMSERPETSPVEMVVVDEEEFRSLPATIANARAYHAQALGDVPGTVKYARRALDLLPESDYFDRGITAALLGLAQWTSGDLEAAHQSIADGISYMRLAGNILFAISGTSVLTDIRVVQGRLHEAISTYEHSLQLAEQQGEPVLQGTADLYLGLSELCFEQGDLGAARQHLLRSEELGEQAALPRWQYRWYLVQARIKEVQGDLDSSLALLNEAERLYFRHAIPDVRPVAALKTRVWVMQDRLAEALSWAREQGLSVDDDLSYRREFEHITLARVLIASGKNDRVDSSIHEAVGLLKRLLQSAEKGRRTGSVIEILVQHALAHHAQGDIPRALAPLERALTLAEPERYVRIFVDEGPPMAQLLSAAVARGILPDYTARLLATFSPGGPEQVVLPKTHSEFVKPLSERELEVLRLLGTELNGPEIARELMVSLNTMRTHTKNIYNKLEVNNRRTAVRRAGELGLL